MCVFSVLLILFGGQKESDWDRHRREAGEDKYLVFFFCFSLSSGLN